MEGPVLWGVLLFVISVALSSLRMAWQARSLLAKYELRYDLAIAELHNSIEDRNFLGKYDLAVADLAKDVRHLKNNLMHHNEIYQVLNGDMIRVQKDVERLIRAVNGHYRQ